jgi:hypothetical protein
MSNSISFFIGLNTNQKTIIELIKQSIFELPPAHYLTLKFLIEHLVK